MKSLGSSPVRSYSDSETCILPVSIFHDEKTEELFNLDSTIESNGKAFEELSSKTQNFPSGKHLENENNHLKRELLEARNTIVVLRHCLKTKETEIIEKDNLCLKLEMNLVKL